MDTKITVEEWLIELEKAQSGLPQQEGFTIREIAEIMGKGLDATRRTVEGLIKCGRVEPLTVRRKSVLNGVTRPVPGFKLVKK